MITERQGIEIDYCPKCRGVWLDRGELDKLIERGSQSGGDIRTAPPQRQDPRPAYQEPYRKKEDEYYYKKKKKDSFLKDLFDF
jgi:Zn-finger nucleic acid-binding protein